MVSGDRTITNLHNSSAGHPSATVRIVGTTGASLGFQAPLLRLRDRPMRVLSIPHQPALRLFLCSPVSDRQRSADWPSLLRGFILGRQWTCVVQRREYGVWHKTFRAGSDVV